MKRLMAGVSVAGLSVMSVVAFSCGSAAFSLESKVLVFLAGVLSFVVGGSGYAATQR